jgi:predicted Zn-dependent protease
MNANELADLQAFKTEELTLWERNTTATMLRNQQALIENLNGRIERMIEKQSHYEAMEHAAGFEAGRQLGMKQERALWELAASTQDIDKHWEKHL